MRLVWTSKVPGETQVQAEEDVAFLLFEQTGMDEEDCQKLARQICITVARRVCPGSTLEIL